MIMNLKLYTQIKHTVQLHIHTTPILSSHILNELYQSNLLFKCENFQKAGSFKIRGAIYAAHTKIERQNSDVLTGHSSGNFAQALARAAKIFGKKAIIVMPENAPRSKVEAVRRYQGQIIFSGNSPADREKKMDEYLKSHPQSIFIHPSNDQDMILGNASCSGELLESTQKLDNIIVPVGGGGLLAGTGLAASLISPTTKVYGAEPAGADDARRSFYAGHIMPSLNPQTIADGLRTQLGHINFPIIQNTVTDILTVTDQEIIDAMKDIYRYLKIVIEPSSAVPLAVVKKHPDIFQNQNNGIILSGGNVDLRTLADIF